MLKRSSTFIIVDILLVTISFGLMSLFKETQFELLLAEYWLPFLFLIILWLTTSYYSGKYNPDRDSKSVISHIATIFKSNFVVLGIVLIILFLWKTVSIQSRILTFGTIANASLLEIIYSILFFYREKVGRIFRHRIGFIFSDIIIVSISFFFMSLMRDATLGQIFDSYLLPFAFYLLLWIVMSFVTGKYNPDRNTEKLNVFIETIVKTNFFTLSIVLAILFLAKSIPLHSRLLIIGTAISSTLFEILYSTSFIYRSKVRREFDMPQTTIVSSAIVSDIVEQELVPEYFAKVNDDEDSIYVLLKNRHLSNQAELFNFIEQNIDLTTIAKDCALILNTPTLFNIQYCDKDSQQLFINVHKTNDIQRINQFFIKVNENLIQGGYFVGCAISHDIERGFIFRRFPFFINRLFYFFIHYPIKRVFPKLPLTKELYFFITKGRNRTISKAEVLGRLYSCGFSVINESQIFDMWYFIARKVKMPITGNTPTYGPLIRLRRIGKDGRYFHVYKFRTMFPFSEYLQDYVYRRNNLQEGGKFKNDFRVSKMGRFMRRFWIDELPMLINWFKGEMKLVGVRPLSQQYFSLYTKELQERRIQYKPGLVPPFYADCPKTLEQIIESELRYLDRYDKHPFITDFVYFFKAFYNIIFKRELSK